MLVLLAGCQTWSLGLGPHDDELLTTLSPAAAAWVAAETARNCFPAADPIPRHRDAPVTRVGANHFVVHYARTGGGSYRVRMNGRLSPPAALAGGPTFSMTGVIFEGAAQLTRAATAAQDRAAISIEPDARGTRLSIHVAGHAESTELTAKVRRALDLAEALDATEELLSRRRSEPAQTLATTTLERSGHGASDPHVLLRSRLTLHLALAQAASDQLVASRHTVTRVLADAPDCRAAHLLRARIDARTATLGNLGRHLQTLTSLPGQPALAHAATLQSSLVREEHTVAERAEALRRQALAWLAFGDDAAAYHWIRRARATGPPSAATLEVLADVYRRLDKRREARETALFELAVHGFRPALVLALHDDCLALGEVEPALRWLARYWTDLRGPHRGEARRRLVADAARTSTDLVTRILLSEHQDPREFGDLLRWEMGLAEPPAGR